MNTINIRPMKKEDLEVVTSIERRVFPDPWSASMFSEQLDLPEVYSLMTTILDQEIIGYGGLLTIRDEGHITNFAVKPEKQSLGVGKSLIYFMFLMALKEGIKSMSLEVRTTNIKAQRLYKQFGFRTIAIRKNYYGYEEDAIVMAIENIKTSAFRQKLDGIKSTLKCYIKDYISLAS